MALTIILLGYGLSSSVVGAAESSDTDALPIEVQVGFIYGRTYSTAGIR